MKLAIGVAAASLAMFISEHDLHALFVVLIAAGTVGVLSGLVLGRRVATAGRSLGVMARKLGDDGPGTDLSSTDRVPSELAALAAELEATSARLAEARARATAVEQSRRQLVAWVSHDLRTPLAGIRAMVEALEDGVVHGPQTVARYHRTLRMEADRLAQLVDDLFELSVIQAGALRLHMERASLADVVSDALASASVLAEARGVRLSGTTDDTAPEVVVSTRGMNRVLRNLLENAIRLTPVDGTVWVEAGVHDERAYVAVADQCGGIPETDLPRVFEPAFRGEVARTPRPDGSAGLGLAIARGIVEAHRGDISVRNDNGGCRFTVRLPLGGAA